MISLTAHALLPHVHLPRAGKETLVFRGILLATRDTARLTGDSLEHARLSLYETAVGKYVLSVSETAQWGSGGKSSDRAVSFSCLEDVRHFLSEEYAGLEGMVHDADDPPVRSRSESAPGDACHLCPENDNPCGRACLPA